MRKDIAYILLYNLCIQKAMMVLLKLICYGYIVGFRHWEILSIYLTFLKTKDGINLSMSTLCRHPNCLDCSDRKPSLTFQHGMLHRYKFMH